MRISHVVVGLNGHYTRNKRMTGKLPSLNALKVFECAARHMSFTKAAVELHVTQTAISHQVRRLEEELGVRLFHRNKERLELTLSGEAYLRGVSAAFDRLRISTEELLREASDTTLTISTLASFATKWLLPRLGSFRREHPEIAIRVTASTDLVDFMGAGADTAIRYGSGDWKGVRSDWLMADEIFPVCSPRLLSGAKPLRKLDDLAHHTLLQVSGMTSNDWGIWLDAAGLRVDVKGSSQLTFDLALMAVQSAVDGHGICIGKRTYVQDDLRAGRLVAPFDISVVTDCGFYLVSPPDLANSDKVVALRKWLFEVIAKSESPTVQARTGHVCFHEYLADPLCENAGLPE